MIGDLTAEEMHEVLTSQEHAHLGCHTSDDVYVVPIFFALKDGYIYGHTYEGQKIEMMRQNPRVCINVHQITDLWNWKSVDVWGEFEELRGEDAIDAVRILSTRLGASTRKSDYNVDLVQNKQSHYSRKNHRLVILYRVRIKKMTGRFERN